MLAGQVVACWSVIGFPALRKPPLVPFEPSEGLLNPTANSQAWLSEPSKALSISEHACSCLCFLETPSQLPGAKKGLYAAPDCWCAQGC